MDEVVALVLGLIAQWHRGRITDRQLQDGLMSAVGNDDEYVTLDSVLGRGRHEDDSGCDLGRA